MNTLARIAVAAAALSALSSAASAHCNCRQAYRPGAGIGLAVRVPALRTDLALRTEVAGRDGALNVDTRARLPVAKAQVDIRSGAREQGRGLVLDLGAFTGGVEH